MADPVLTPELLAAYRCGEQGCFGFGLADAIARGEHRVPRE